MMEPRPNGYPDTYKAAKPYRSAKGRRKGYYWDSELQEYRHFHEDGTDAKFTICLCGKEPIS